MLEKLKINCSTVYVTLMIIKNVSSNPEWSVDKKYFLSKSVKGRYIK